MKRAVFVSVVLAIFLRAIVDAQSPHGGSQFSPQPGPNTNAAGGIVADPNDPAALLKSDILVRQQNETVIGGSTRNPDHLLAAANDYRFVDFPKDEFFGERTFIAKLLSPVMVLARMLGLKEGSGEEEEERGAKWGHRAPKGAAASVGAWTGVYRSCDRGHSWIGSALPGSPLDSSPASVGPPVSPLKALSNSAPAGAHAETTDPVLLSGPNGRMHLIVLGFVRNDVSGAVGNSRMYYASYTDRNNLEGGTCFTYDFTREIDRASNYGPNAFIDKGSGAIDKDGTIYVAYTVFTDSVNSKVVIARSTDGGATWSRTMPLLSLGFLRNHGTSVTVDRLNGSVYVAWRLFYQNWPLMVISRSFDRGKTFLPATPISHFWPTKNLDQIIQQLKAAKLQPFDQFTSLTGQPATARTLAFPNIVAGVVNGRSKLFAVWQERANVSVAPNSPEFGQPYADGSPRIMFSMSSDGWSWTPRRAIDAGPRGGDIQNPLLRPSGPQVQPVLSFSGSINPQLLLAYYEARDEVLSPFGSNFISGITSQMDMRVARIDPASGQLVASSSQVSQYAIEANSNPPKLLKTARDSGFDAVSRQNSTMYGGGFNAFFGDYPHITQSVVFESNSPWNWTADPSSALLMWTDNRDVQIPHDPTGNISIDLSPWPYTPVRPGAGVQVPTECSNVGTRNANPYFAEIAGVVAGSPQTFKRLNIQRAFVTYVENRTPVDRFFRLAIIPESGVFASFAQFSSVPVRDLPIFGNSSHTQTIWVEKNLANLTGKVRMTVTEIDAIGAATFTSGGYRTSLTLNPDPNNDALTPVPSPDLPSGANFDSSEIHGLRISAPQFSAFRIANPQYSAPQFSAPQYSAVQMPQYSAPQYSAPQFSAPQFSAPTIPAGEQNGTDVTFTITNPGTTTSSYNALFNVANVEQLLTSGNYQFQVLITRTSFAPGFVFDPNLRRCVPAAETKVQVITNLPIPQFSAPQYSAINNPQFSAPQFSAFATFAVAPSGGAEGSATAAASTAAALSSAAASGAAALVSAAAPTSDGQSFVLPHQVEVTLRAIRRRAAAAGGPTFNRNQVVLRVNADSTNVINEVVQANGTQPTVVSPSQLAFLVQPTATTVSGRSIHGSEAPDIKVAIKDAFGQTVTSSNLPVTIAIAAGEGPSPTLYGTTTRNAVGGIATFSGLAIGDPGIYALSATSGTLTPATSSEFTILAPPSDPLIASLITLPICGDQGDPGGGGTCGTFSFTGTYTYSSNNPQLYTVPGSGTMNLNFDWIFKDATFNNELGIYKVDDAIGSVNGLHSGDLGYLTAAFNRAQIIFPSGSGPTTPDVPLHFQAGDRLAFFIVQDNTLANLRLNNPANSGAGFPLAFFSIGSLNPDHLDHAVAFTNLDTPFFVTEFGFEDLNATGGDFNDLVFTITPSSYVLIP